MRHALVVLCALLASAGGPGILGQAEPGGRDDEDPLAALRRSEELPKMLRVPLIGPIGAAVVDRLKRDIRTWLEDEPLIHFVVLEIDTPGGELEAAIDLADFLSRELRKVISIAFIPPGKMALSAGALIAVAANHIVMGENSHMGAAAPVGVRPRPDGSFDLVELGAKEQSVVKEQFRTYAGKRGYPTILTDAMVTKALSDIFKVTVIEFHGADEVEVTKFLTDADYKNLKRQRKAPTVGEAEVILHAGELLTMSAEKALDYGFARHIANNLGELRELMNITIPDENVIDVDRGALRPSSPAAQALIDFLNHPIVRCLLLMGGCLGILFELKLLGTMLPGAIGLGCFAIFFIGAALPVTGSVHGSASVYEIVLFLVGVGLVAVEVVFPGFAIFAISGIAIASVSIVLAMIPGETSSIDTETAIQSALTIFLGSFFLGLALFFAMIKYLPQLPGVRRRGGLVSDAAIVGVPTADSALDDQARTSRLLGQSGLTTTALRPAGKVELESGEVVNVVSSGEFIEKGSAVTVESIEGPRIVVVRARHDGS